MRVMQTDQDKPDRPDSTIEPNVDTRAETTPAPPKPETPVQVDAPEPLPTPLPTQIDLLRHGQVATPNLFCAPVNEPLGIAGWKQLTLATQNGAWDVVITSPTRRCHDFAKLLAQRLDCHFLVEPLLSEMDFGSWMGKTHTELWEQFPELMQQLWNQPRRFTAPGGERMEDFINRVTYAWEEIYTHYAGQRILILTHAGVIRVILSIVLDILYQKSLRFEINYAQISRVRVYPDGVPSLVAHGLPHV